MRGTWNEVTNRLEALGLKLKLHLAQAKGEEAPDALGTLRTDIRKAFEAAGNAANDEAVRADAREVGLLFADVIAQTLREAGNDLHDAVSRRS